MKKVCLLLFFILNWTRIFADGIKGVSFYDEMNFSHTDKDKAKYDAGVKINFKNASSIFSFGINSTPIDEIFSTANISQAKFRYGIEGKFSADKISSSVKLGTLSFNQSVSRLKNPVPTSISPFKKTSLIASGFLANLPNFTGGTKPLSLNLSLENKFKYLPVFDFAAVFDNKNFMPSDFYFDARKNFKNFNYGFTAAIFNLGNDDIIDTSSWYNSKKWFKEKKYVAFEGSMNFIFKNFRFALDSGIHENPFGLPFLWQIVNSFFVKGGFCMNSCVFFSDPNLITIDGTSPNTRFMAQQNFQYSLPINRTALNFGISGQYALKQAKEIKMIDYSQKQFKFSFSALQKKDSFYFNAGTLKSSNEKFWNFNFNAKYNHFFKKFSLQTYCSFKAEDNFLQNEYYLSERLKFKKSILQSLNIDSTFVQKNDGLYSTKISSGMTFYASSKKITGFFKLNFSYKI